MKKVFFAFICLFIFTFNVHAATSTIEFMKARVDIDENGDATVEETYHIERGKAYSFDREFQNLKGVKITSLTISDTNDTKYYKSGSFSAGEEGLYYIYDGNNSKLLRISTSYSEETYTISYKVSGMIKEFKDGPGYDWTFSTEKFGQTIQNYEIAICNPNFSNDTVGMEAVGDSTYYSVDNNCMNVSATGLYDTTEMRVLAQFYNIDFKNKVKINSTYELYQSKADGTYTIAPMVEKIGTIAGNALKIIVLIIIIVLSVLGIKSFLYLNNLFGGIKCQKGKTAKMTTYDKMPCDGDLYKMSVLINYYDKKIDPTNLMVAIVTKWALEGNAKILIDEKNNTKVLLRENNFFINDLDKDLYRILLKAAGDYELEKKELDSYLKDKYELLIDWYREAIKYTIKDEYSLENVEVKEGINDKYILNNNVYQKYIDLKSLKNILKKYNNINKEIDKEEYEHLLLASILLDEDVSLTSTLLKNNPNDKKAIILSKANNLRNLFKSSFKNSKNKYNFRKKKKIIDYNPTK